jgi:hypothetical protein
MCGLPVFPPKPKHENPAPARRTLRRIAAWLRDAKKVQPNSEEAHADRPVVRGEPLPKAAGGALNSARVPSQLAVHSRRARGSVPQIGGELQ